jgi:hypothetical protein
LLLARPLSSRGKAAARLAKRCYPARLRGVHLLGDMRARNRGASPVSGFLLALFVAGSSGAFTDGELALDEINAYRSEVRPGTCECRPECIVRSEAKHAPRGYRGIGDQARTTPRC